MLDLKTKEITESAEYLISQNWDEGKLSTARNVLKYAY